MPNRDIVVIGASAGGLDPLLLIARDLPADLPAAVFVVVHTSPQSPGYLADILSRAGPLPAAYARDDEPFLNGRIYVAPPDYHMLLSAERRVEVIRGPRETARVRRSIRSSGRPRSPSVPG